MPVSALQSSWLSSTEVLYPQFFCGSSSSSFREEECFMKWNGGEPLPMSPSRWRLSGLSCRDTCITARLLELSVTEGAWDGALAMNSSEHKTMCGLGPGLSGLHTVFMNLMGSLQFGMGVTTNPFYFIFFLSMDEWTRLLGGIFAEISINSLLNLCCVEQICTGLVDAIRNRMWPVVSE